MSAVLASSRRSTWLSGRSPRWTTHAAIGSYYTFMDGGDRLADHVLSTPRGIRDAVATFAGLGADEVMLYCWARDADQVDRLADVVA
jgi:hypothetical protein